MGPFNTYLNHTLELSSKQIYLEYDAILVEGERIEKALRVDRDKFIFTNCRILFILYCKGGKYEFLSVPYLSIKKFSIIGKSLNDEIAELNIYLLNEDKPIKKEIRSSELLSKIYRIVSSHIFSRAAREAQLLTDP